MKTLLLPIFFAALVMASPAWAQTTQTEIQADLLQTQIIAELKAKNYAKADALFQEYDALGVAMPPPLQLQRALTHFHLKKYWEAEKLLLVYLQRAQRGSDEYRQALSMLAEVKPLAAPARAEAARAAAIKREQEAKARAREATKGLLNSVDESLLAEFGTPITHISSKEVEGLLRAGADVHVKDRYGNTPLHYVASCIDHESDCHRVISLLLSHGADVNAKTHKGNTPLHIATGYYCSFDRDRCYRHVSLLLSNGAHVNAKDEDGETPLFNAVRYADEGKNDASIVELLLRAGADPNVKNNNGVTILKSAKGKGRAVKKLLREHGATK